MAIFVFLCRFATISLQMRFPCVFENDPESTYQNSFSGPTQSSYLEKKKKSLNDSSSLLYLFLHALLKSLSSLP